MAKIQRTEEDAVSPGAHVGAAKDWAEGRKPVDLSLELFVRMQQLLTPLARLCLMHGIDLDGLDLDSHAGHPAPTPEELRQWLEQLLPQEKVNG